MQKELNNLSLNNKSVAQTLLMGSTGVGSNPSIKH